MNFMTEKENQISNTSYINKDFQTIYPELLEKAKELSYKWNPTESNESDPGVVLIKENAIIADQSAFIANIIFFFIRII